MPPQGTLGFRIQGYGFKTWGDLFTPRQALALTTFARLVRESHRTIVEEVGHEIMVEVIGIDDRGRVNLSRREALQELARQNPPGRLVDGGDDNEEESKVIAEKRRVRDLPDLAVSIRTARVKVKVGGAAKVFTPGDELAMRLVRSH